jgi:ribosomal-protein-alanine N-acetyltransferase
MREGIPAIETDRLLLRLARLDEGRKIAQFLRRNREHLAPWEPARDDAYFEDERWQDVPSRERERALAGTDYRFRILFHGGEDFIGVVALRDITGWPVHFAAVGYSIDFAHEGRGLMTEALDAVIRFGFEELNLNRIEACRMRANAASARVMEKLGFEEEGVIRRGLLVRGRWEDQVLSSVLNPNWEPA